MMQKIEELIEEKKRLEREIRELKRKQAQEEKIKIVRYPTGKMDFRVRPFDDARAYRQFFTIASGWSKEELFEQAKTVALRIMEFCEKTDDEIAERTVNE